MKTLSEIKETAYNTCLEIEQLPPSTEQTALSMRASSVVDYINKLIQGQKEPEAGKYPCQIFSAQELSEKLASKLIEDGITKATFSGDNFSVQIRTKKLPVVKV